MLWPEISTHWRWVGMASSILLMKTKLSPKPNGAVMIQCDTVLVGSNTERNRKRPFEPTILLAQSL